MLRRLRLVGAICLLFGLSGCGSGGSGGSVSAGATKSQMGGSVQGQPVTSTGVVTTLAGSAARPFQPFGITTDGTNLYIADANNNTIRKIVIATGAVTTLAGTASTAGHADGTGPAASFDTPSGIATDGANLYVADTGNNTIRKIEIATGAATTLAGTASTPGHADKTGSDASFNASSGIATDGTNLYVADTGNNTIRKIVIATGVVTTLAGTASAVGHADGTGPAASFNIPSGIATDGANLYVADTGNNTIRKIVTATGAVTTLAGTASTSGYSDGVGSAASFSSPHGITTDGTHLFVADTYYNLIREIVIATRQVTTILSLDDSTPITLHGSDDGIASAASFYQPFGLTTDGTNLYVADYRNGRIRKVVIATGAVTTLACPVLSFAAPTGITTDGTNLYVVDTSTNSILKVAPATGAVTPLVGTAAGLTRPYGITTDGTNLFVADTGSNTIKKIVIATGAVTVLAGETGTSGSADTGTGVTALFNSPYGITTDGTNLYVADTENNTIRKIVIATGAVTTLAGTAGTPGHSDKAGPAASFNSPYGIITDGTSLFVADTGNNTIRKIQ
jgi:sugar lactone lactonase YvrE